MICPDNANVDFDDMLCKDCKHFQYCFEKWQTTDNFGKQGELDGDNFPMIKNEYNTQEQEIINSINTIGFSHTWYMIEELSNINLRLRYRTIFFKYGGKVPYRGE